jgi:2-hydroxy-3-oxopropionate reductase
MPANVPKPAELRMGSLPRLGFIGLGIMGAPMATRLLGAGYSLTVQSRTSARAVSLLDAGARWADTAAEIAASSDIVITMLPDSPDVDSVYVGDQGIVHGARPGLLAIDMSTIDPMVTRAICERLRDRQIDLLDAPVSGGERGALDGTLSIMVGGSTSGFEVARPIFEHLGHSVVHVGPAGAGQIAKACNQLVVGTSIEAVAEALTLAKQSGVDPAIVRQVLLGGFAASRVLEVHGQRMLDRAFLPGFRVSLHRKDARVVRTLAQSVGAPIPAFDIVADALDRLDRAGGGDLDHSALITLLDPWRD